RRTSEEELTLQISISAYQTQRGNRCTITPVCPGLFAWKIHSGDVGKARQRVIERLRKEFPKLERHEMSRLFVPMGRNLERVRRDLTLEEGGDKKHVAGVFPVVVESRHTGLEEPLRIAYHPLRPAEWFEIAGASP